MGSIKKIARRHHCVSLVTPSVMEQFSFRLSILFLSYLYISCDGDMRLITVGNERYLIQLGSDENFDYDKGGKLDGSDASKFDNKKEDEKMGTNYIMNMEEKYPVLTDTERSMMGKYDNKRQINKRPHHCFTKNNFEKLANKESKRHEVPRRSNTIWIIEFEDIDYENTDYNIEGVQYEGNLNQTDSMSSSGSTTFPTSAPTYLSSTTNMSLSQGTMPAHESLKNISVDPMNSIINSTIKPISNTINISSNAIHGNTPMVTQGVTPTVS